MRRRRAIRYRWNEGLKRHTLLDKLPYGEALGRLSLQTKLGDYIMQVLCNIEVGLVSDCILSS